MLIPRTLTAYFYCISYTPILSKENSKSFDMHHVCMLQSCMPCQFLTNGIFWTFIEPGFASSLLQWNIIDYDCYYQSDSSFETQTTYPPLTPDSRSSSGLLIWKEVPKRVTAFQQFCRVMITQLPKPWMDHAFSSR